MTSSPPGAPLNSNSVITRVVAVAGGRFAPGYVGELTRIVPFEMVDAVLVETGTVQKRLRICPHGWWSTCCWPLACSPNSDMGRCGRG